MNDITDEDFWDIPRYYNADAIAYAEEHGLDLMDGKAFLHDWRSYFIMTWAHVNGMLSAEKQLAREAEQFRKPPSLIGNVRGCLLSQDFCFIRPFDGGSEAFLHRAEIQRSGLSGLEDGAVLAYETEEGSKGLRAVRPREALVSEEWSAYYPGSRRVKVEASYDQLCSGDEDEENDGNN